MTKILDGYLTTQQTAQILGESVDRVRKLARQGKLKSETLYDFSPRFFHEDEVRKFQEYQNMEQQQEDTA